ncbi:MAG TPA: DNA-processing protein DprA [Candidatus Binataceae bacterium]|jgi:DNA processing protein|nr:DNA-processing protein DprA [Candidatus Binataceae bacterium]
MAPSADAYWLGLRRVHGVGPRIARLLLERFKTPERVFAESPEILTQTGIPRPTAHNISAFRDFAPIEKELCELPRLGARLVRWSDADYPAILRHIPDPPPYFFLRGTLPNEARSIAVVGARTASDAGRRMAQRLWFELAGKGFAVVSGLARGIDSEAHQGALDAGGHTVAVIGCGIDVMYPPENRKLAEAIIAGGGALISELPVGTPPVAENFPVRNRLISGLCLGVVVVEAAEKSGSLITARMALEQDRQVFAVPGSPLTGKSRGSNRLIKEGARMVDCVEDVLEDLAPQLIPAVIKAGSAPQLDPIAVEAGSAQQLMPAPVEAGAKDRAFIPAPRLRAPVESPHADSEAEPDNTKVLLDCLKEADKLHVDSLIEGSRLNAQTVLNLMLELELKGIVVQHPGKLFALADPSALRRL